MRKRRIVLAGIILTMALAGCGKKDVATQGITEPEAGQQTEASKEEMPEQGSAAAESLEDTVAIQPDIIVNVYPDEEGKVISPYIYGVNAGVNLSSVSAGSLRLGGNRMTAYNWENNVSNAGSDWYNSSDMYMVQDIPKNLASQPGAAALNVSAEAMEYQVPYALLTLPMLGYVANESSGYLGEEEAAPSAYWCQVLNRKEGEYTLEPDTQDGVVYNDEYLHYLFEKIGDSGSASGFKGYALDNEPALWNATHSLAQREKLTCTELLEKTTDLALVIKEMDPGADVFGPALYGYYAFLCLQDAPDWREIQAENGYRWFIDYYLDTMEEKEQEHGCRLLDVLDLHYYSEARGACGERLCEHYEEDACIKARIDSVRSLWDGDYKEDSWIMDTGAKFFPLLPNVRQSIDEYYPGTKIAFTEYDFGGGDHISGGVAQADFLGTLASHEVYLATLWSFDKNDFQLGAINLFTDYDGAGSGFGDILIPSETEDDYIVSSYAAYDSEKGNTTVRVILTNKSIHEEITVSISLNGDNEYTCAQVYELSGDNPAVQEKEAGLLLDENVLTYTLTPLSVTEFVISVNP